VKGKLSLTLAERLEAFSIPEPNSGCILWLKCEDEHGYGMMQYKKFNTRAHRLSWIAHRGPIPPGMHVLHHCDVRPCINPDHLYIGDNDDNMADRQKRGRHKPLKGEANGQARFTEDDVLKIRAMDKPIAHIARELQCSETAIRLIRQQKTWKHI
jgi:hypothetical protein